MAVQSTEKVWSPLETQQEKACDPIAPRAEPAPIDPGLKPVPRLLLVDDDPVFCEIMAKAAKQSDVELTVCRSLRDVSRLHGTTFMDAAIVDYFLGDCTGVDVAPTLGALPVVMISRSDSCLGETPPHWPMAVRRFVNKDAGPQAILAAAMSVGKEFPPSPAAAPR